ncbi:MAG: twin-arginine translocase subunit TatB [Clostridia bacterium]|nr:twin-arginine translocase subunit TatB [Clostridia bacterium]
MFNIGFAELILVLLVAFLVVGPKDLPKVARWLGRCVRKARQLIREVKQEIGWDELTKETKSIKQDLDQTIKDSDITADIRSASNDFKKSVDDARKSTGLKKP